MRSKFVKESPICVLTFLTLHIGYACHCRLCKPKTHCIEIKRLNIINKKEDVELGIGILSKAYYYVAEVGHSLGGFNCEVDKIYAYN